MPSMTELQQELARVSDLQFRWYPLLSTSDLGQANRDIRRFVDPLKFSCRRNEQNWGIHITRLSLERFRIFGVRHGPAHATSSAPLRSYHVIVPLTGTLSARVGFEQVTAAPGAAVVYPPGSRISGQWSGNSIALVVTITDKELRRFSKKPAMWNSHGGFPTPKLDLTRGPGRSFANLLVCLCMECDRHHQGVGNSSIIHGLEDLLLVALLDMHEQVEPIEFNEGSTRRRRDGVALAVNYILRNRRRALSIEELCTVACLSRRSLEIAFVEQYSVGPMTYARRVRLEKARDELLSGQRHEVSISEVAWRWGFTNPGSFTRVYRQTFGETPSQTLRRRRNLDA